MACSAPSPAAAGSAWGDSAAGDGAVSVWTAEGMGLGTGSWTHWTGLGAGSGAHKESIGAALEATGSALAEPARPAVEGSAALDPDAPSSTLDPAVASAV